MCRNDATPLKKECRAAAAFLSRDLAQKVRPSGWFLKGCLSSESCRHFRSGSNSIKRLHWFSFEARVLSSPARKASHRRVGLLFNKIMGLYTDTDLIDLVHFGSIGFASVWDTCNKYRSQSDFLHLYLKQINFKRLGATTKRLLVWYIYIIKSQ